MIKIRRERDGKGKYRVVVRRNGKIFESVPYTKDTDITKIKNKFRRDKSIKSGIRRRVLGTKNQIFEIVSTSKEPKIFKKEYMRADGRDFVGSNYFYTSTYRGKKYTGRSMQFTKRKDLEKAKNDARDNLINVIAHNMNPEKYESSLSGREEMIRRAKNFLSKKRIRSGTVSYQNV